MFKFAEQSLPIDKVLGQGFALYKATFSKVWYLILVNFLIIGLVDFVSYRYSPLVKTIEQVATPGAHPSWLQMLLIVTPSFIAALTSVYFISVVICRIYDIGGGASATSLRNPFIVVLHKWFNLAVAKVFLLLLVMLGTIMLIVPGFLIGILLVFCIPAILFEDKGVWHGFKRSVELVWDNFWRTAAVLVSPSLILIVGALLEQGISRSLHEIWMGWSIFAIYCIILAPLPYSILLVQYNDLKLRKLDQNQGNIIE